MLPKLHLITSKDFTRPAMNYVQITRSEFMATDAHVAAIIPTEKLPISNKELLPEEPVYLHGEKYKRLTLSSIDLIAYDPEKRGFLVIHKNNRPDDFVDFDRMDERFPDVPSVFPEWNDAKEQHTLGINPKLLYSLFQAMGDPKEKRDSLALRFTGVNKGVLAKTTTDSLGALGLIMPIYIDYETGLGKTV